MTIWLLSKVDKVQILCTYFIPWRFFVRDLLNDSLLFGNHIDSSGKKIWLSKKIELREKRENENNCSLMSSLSLSLCFQQRIFYDFMLISFLRICFFRCCFSAFLLYNVGLIALYSTHFPLIQFGFYQIVF